MIAAALVAGLLALWSLTGIVDMFDDLTDPNQTGDDDSDALFGDVRSNILDGQGGDDILTGNGSADELYGGAGDDLLYAGSGQDFAGGGEGNDIIYGFNGDDELFGGDGNDTVFGGGSRDTIVGGDGDDYLNGNVGHDVVYGGDGDDTLVGNEGNDNLFGSGNDWLSGGEDNDFLVLRDDLGTGSMFGGKGEDVLVAAGASSLMTGGQDADSFWTLGTNMTDSAQNNVITDYDPEEDVISFFVQQALQPTLYQFVLTEVTTDVGTGTRIDLAGPDGSDVGAGSITLLDVAPADVDTTDFFIIPATTGADEPGFFSLLEQTARQQEAGGPNNQATSVIKTLAERSTLDGTDGDDTLIGDDLENTITGGIGDDVIDGQGAADEITAGEGNDIIDAGEGNDFVLGNDGDDTINGEDGEDIIYGGSGADELRGGAGDDNVYGGSGDAIFGGLGDDTIHVRGELTSETTVEGNKDEDRIYTEYSDITISGGQDADAIWLDNLDTDTAATILGFDSTEDIMVVEATYIPSGVGDTAPADFSVDDVTYTLTEQTVDGVVQTTVTPTVDLTGTGSTGFYAMTPFILVGVAQSDVDTDAFKVVVTDTQEANTNLFVRETLDGLTG